MGELLLLKMTAQHRRENMSLDFSLTKAMDRKGKTFFDHPDDSEKWHPVTEAMVWRLMAIDIGEITEKNVSEVWFRVRMYELLSGTYAIAWNEPATTVQLTREDVENHIGLSTNVSTKSRGAWLKSRFEKARADQLANMTQAKSAHEMVNERCAELKAKARMADQLS
jgi:hypothetical protein